VGIWTWPKREDVEAFDEHYERTHYPTAMKVPGAQRVTVLKAEEAARDSGIYVLAEMYFDDEAAYSAASTSPEWAAMAQDATWMMERFDVALNAVAGYEQT
jgi:uncharacterized protein (TIGR02118 family)